MSIAGNYENESDNTLRLGLSKLKLKNLSITCQTLTGQQLYICRRTQRST